MTHNIISYLMRKGCAILMAGTVVMACEAMAQNRVERHSFHRYWSTFAAPTKNGSCFAASKPVSSDYSKPVTDRGEPYLMVASYPSSRIKNQISVVLGFEANNSRGVSLIIDGKEFRMFSQGIHAWLASTADNETVITAMRRGSKAVIKAVSASRGTVIEDEYSLLGFTKALTTFNTLCR